MNLSIINANTDLGVMVDGSNPIKISKHFKKDKRINKIITINKGNVIKDKSLGNKERNIIAINKFNRRLYKTVIKEKNNNNFPIILGGDHSLSIGSALGSINNTNLGIIWIDSHGDYNTFDTTKTGNIHGLPLASLNGLTNNKLSFFHKGPYYNSKNTVIVGARDIDDWELPVITDNKINYFTTNDIKSLGSKEVIKKAIDIASKDVDGIHISYDLDIIDPMVAPGVSVPAKNGITEEEAYQLLDEVLKYKHLIKSIDLVEFNPTKDISQKTEKIAINLLEKIINAFK